MLFSYESKRRFSVLLYRGTGIGYEVNDSQLSKTCRDGDTAGQTKVYVAPAAHKSCSHEGKDSNGSLGPPELQRKGSAPLMSSVNSKAAQGE